MPPAFPDILGAFVPTPHEVVDRMLRLAQVRRDDVVYDLGCGDGRIPIAAARDFGARGVGLDIEPYRVAESETNAKAAGVEQQVEFRLEDAQQADIRPATVVMLYLAHWSNLRLRPKLQSSLRPGSRIVSLSFDMRDWEPAKLERFNDAEGGLRTIFLWVIGQR